MTEIITGSMTGLWKIGLIAGVILAIIMLRILSKKVDFRFFHPTSIFFLTITIRKFIGFVLLGIILFILIYAKLLGLFLLAMFFNMAIVFMLTFLLGNKNGLFSTILLFILGITYAVLPIFPGPTIGMTFIFHSLEFGTAEHALDSILLATCFMAKALVCLGSIFLLISYRRIVKIDNK